MLNFLKNKIGSPQDNGAFILFDVGGTKTRVAASFDGKTFGEPRIAPTPKNFKEGIEVLKKLADEVSGGRKVKAVCGGVPGVLDRERKNIFRLPNLPEWNGAPITGELTRVFGAPAYVENDSELVGLGEAVAGAGKGYNIVAYITVSTGVGGARIVGGRIDQKVFGFEPGWQIINFTDLAKDKDSAYLGYHISGGAIEKRFGKDPREIKDEVFMNELAAVLACGLHNSILHWSPDALILGGSMITGINPIPLDKIEIKLREILTVFPEVPAVKKASLGDLGGLFGALEFVSKKQITE